MPQPAAVACDASVPFTLRVDNPGLSYRLAWQEWDLPQPGPGELLIEVRAAVLNYRDIMQSAGLLPEEAIEGTLGEGVRVGVRGRRRRLR